VRFVVIARILAAAGLVVTCLAGCVSRAPHSNPSMLGGQPQQPTFDSVKTAIDDLYRKHPDIASFSAQDVQYNAITRDKVLDVCRRGGPETDRAALESARVVACAPLIFFFYAYGNQASVAASTDVAQQLYWYAVTSIDGPVDARQSLTALLKEWGIS
jgi:hypothetical protein